MQSVCSSNIKIKATKFPSFLYPPNADYNPNKPLIGLLRSPLLVWVSVFKHLKSCKTENSKTQAEIHKIKSVEPFGIAYAAVMVRLIIRSLFYMSDPGSS